MGRKNYEYKQPHVKVNLYLLEDAVVVDIRSPGTDISEIPPFCRKILEKNAKEKIHMSIGTRDIINPYAATFFYKKWLDSYPDFINQEDKTKSFSETNITPIKEDMDRQMNWVSSQGKYNPRLIYNLIKNRFIIREV